MTSEAYVEHVRDLLASIADLRLRRMFGGWGVYSRSRMFALVTGDQLYIKTDAASRPEFETAGSAPFSFQAARGRATITSYWRLPAGAEDDPEQVERWARLGLAAAERAQKPRRAKTSAPADLGPGPWNG